MPIGNGGIIGPNNTPSTSSAKGVWSIREAMLAQRAGNWPVVQTADPYFEYTTLLLPGNGTNGAQNNTFLDSSTNAFSITRNGNTTQGTFSPFSQTGWGNYFGAASNKIATTGMTQLGSDFTLECWIFPTSFANYNTIFDSRTSDGDANGFVFGLTSAAKIYFYTNSNFQITTTLAIPANTWTHVALVRSGSGSGNVKIYINGIQDATTATYTTSFTRTAPSIGCDWNTRSNLQYYGYISNLRATTGALYTSDFTPSAIPLTTTVSAGTCVLLTCQANRFIDASASALTITVTGTPSVQAFSPFNPTASWSAATNGGSGYFDGSGDYLTAASNAAFDMGSGDFTVEFWLYPTSLSGTQVYVTRANNSSTYPSFEVNLISSTIGLYTSSTGSSYNVSLSSSVALKLNAWNHVAATRNGSTFTIWVNGASGGTATSALSLTANGNSLGIGGYPSGTNTISGYLADVRIVKGTAVYTSAFTPPTAPLTAISGTSLLTNFTNAGIYDATSKNDLETLGNAQISTTQSKFGGSSMYFDGSGDYLLGPWNPPTDLGAGDFTIEFWMYPTAAGQSSLSYLFNLATNANYGPIVIGQAASGYGIVLYASSTGSSWNLASGSSFGTATQNAWNHVALTRYGANVRLFLNGIAATTLNWGTTALLTGSSYRPNIGSGGGVANTFYTGYMQDLRVTKGIARYTSNFTPPTTAFLTL